MNEKMNCFTCPVCKGALKQEGNSLYCEKRHCYDISRRGYVNLLMSQASKEARHGDGKDMVDARRDFLSLGLYDKIASAVTDEIVRSAKHKMFVLDVGCGECYYTEKVASALINFDAIICGIDISKDALTAGSKRSADISLAVASAFDLPVGDGRVDVLMNLFAPHDEGEFRRVMRPGGLLIRAFPAERHLFELKTALYDAPYENEKPELDIDGFKTANARRLTYEIKLMSSRDVKNLFKMTPYSYKTGANDEKKLDDIDNIKLTIDVIVASYIKK